MALTADILSNLLGLTLPLQDADIIYIVRPSDLEPKGKKVTWGDIKAAIAGGTVIQNFTTNLFAPQDGEDGQDGFAIPGPVGAAGVGIAGADGKTILPDAPEDPQDPFIVPGKDGAAGVAGGAGTPGAAGKDGFTILPDPPEDPADPQPLGFPALPDPVIGSYAPGGFEIPSGKYVDMAGMLQLIGTQQLVGKGNSVLRISGNV